MIKITKLLFIEKCNFYAIIENIDYAYDVEAAENTACYDLFIFALSREHVSECVIRFFPVSVSNELLFVCLCNIGRRK